MATALVFGVANKWSIAWSIARAWDAAGTNVIMVCRSDREQRTVEKLANELQNKYAEIIHKLFVEDKHMPFGERKIIDLKSRKEKEQSRVSEI